MNRRTRNILIASAVGLMFVAAVLIVFLTNGGKRFGWDLQGYWVTVDGTIQGQESFSISGSVTDQPDQLYDHVKMKYTFPSSQKFSFSSDTGVFSSARILHGVSYYSGATLSFSSDENAYIPSIYAIDLDKCYVLLNFGDDSGLYFVAATDPNVEPMDILEHFQKIVEKNPFETKPTEAESTQIDWEMTAYRVMENSTVVNGSDQAMSITGKFPKGFKAYSLVEAEVDLTWPEGLQFQGDTYTVYGNYAHRHGGQAYFLASGYASDPSKNTTQFMTVLICPDYGFAVIHLDGASDYWVASTNPNADKAWMVEFYKAYVKTNE